MFCCRGREKTNKQDNQQSKREMVERYILSTCKQTDEDSFDQSFDQSRVQFIDYDKQNYEKILWSPTQWQMNILSRNIGSIDKYVFQHLIREEIKRNLRNGILKNLRPCTWFWLSDINNKWIKMHNIDIYYKLKSCQSFQDNQIFKDIKSMDKKFSDLVFDIARAYANYDVEYGYVSGMHLIIKYIIQSLDPEQYPNQDYSFNNFNRTHDFYDVSVFWMTVHVLISLEMRKCFKNQTSFTITEKFNNTLMPSIKELLNRFSKPINQMISQPLLFLFQKSFKQHEFDLIFDLYIYEGENILQQILLKLLKLSENFIVMYSTESDLAIYLTQSLIPYGISQIQKTHTQNYMNILLL